MIEANVQVIKEIGLKITNDDVDGFMEDLDLMFKSGVTKADALPRVIANEYPTLHKIWMEIKANQ